MAADLYEAPRIETSQGDILELLPHVYLERPLLSLTKDAESTLRTDPEPFAHFDDKAGQLIVATCKRQRAILITHDCECDKPQVKKWLASPVRPSAPLGSKTRDELKRNRIYSMLHLPEYGEVLPDSFVDFNQITTLDAEFIKSAKRIVSLSDIGRRALYVQFIRWLTRWELRKVVCPSCSVTFDPADFLPVR